VTATASSPTITTIDPASGVNLQTYRVHGRATIDAALDGALATYRTWRSTSSQERSLLLAAAARTLRARKTELATLASREMGKTLVEAEAEVEKCAVGCAHYAERGGAYLADTPVPSTAAKSYIAYRPLGTLLAIMPWNFPFWQAFRAAAPALMAGNVVVLKHAANVTGCALAIEKIFTDSGFPKGAFTTLVVAGSDMEAIVADPRVACVTLTGSEAAGSAVAAVAGKHLKKTVLELGGSDAFIVLADADIEAAAKVAVTARFQNNGQSCIAAKRFIVEASAYDEFLEAFVRNARELVIGDPLEKGTTLGPLARADLRDALAKQVTATLVAGATLALGGTAVDRPGYYYEATIVAGVTREMTMFDEETFGPAAAVVRARNLDHAVELANASQYGLGGNLWTRDIERAEHVAERLESGGVFINGMTASDARLPFGGVKRSGYGRELSAFGIHEFVNVQTVWIGPARETAAPAPSDRAMKKDAPPFTRLDHVQLAMPAGQEDRARDFYVDILSLEEIAKPAELAMRGGIWLRSDGVALHLGVDADFRPAKKAHPAFRCADYDGLIERLRERGVTVISDDVLFEGKTRCYIADPFGNRLELIASVAHHK